MSDLGKVVQKLTETNLRLETLEKQNIESNTAASIIAQSLPEVLNDRSIATNRESFDKKEGITGTDDDVRDNTKKLGKKIDKLNMNPKKDDDPNFIGPPLAPSKTGSDEEEDSDRMKALKKVFSPLTKSFNAVSKSITGFIGGMAKTVTGGAELFLKGIVTATALGLLIKFLKSDYFKEFLSEENLNKLADFFKNIGAYMDDLFDYLADTTNPSSIAFAIAAGAGIFLAGGLISKIIGGVVGTFKFLRTLGTLFGIGGALSATATAAGTTSVATTAAGAAGGIGLLGTAAVVAGVALLAKMSYEGIAAAQKSYMEGNTFGRVVADGLGAFLTLGMFPDLAKAIADFLAPTDDQKISQLEKSIKNKKKLIAETKEERFKNQLEVEMAKQEKELAKLKKNAPGNAETKKRLKEERVNQDNFDKKRAEFIRKEKNKARDLVKEKQLRVGKKDKDGKLVTQTKAELEALIVANNPYKATKILGNRFDLKNEEFNPAKLKRLGKKLLELNEDRIKKEKEEAKALSRLMKRNEENLIQNSFFKSNASMSGIDGGGATINNTTIVKQGDNSSSTTTVAAKPIKNLSFHEVYVSSY